MSHIRHVEKALIPGFENVNRYWDQENQIVAAKLMPGDYYVTKQDEMITTVLGSCVAACIRDVVTGVGGMNHFMLPETSKSRLNDRDEAVVGNASRYGNYAMEHLINSILQNGGKRKNLEVKLFGGGKIIATLGDVGARNIQFVLDYVDTEALNLVSQDLGDIYPRKVNFFPQTGRVRMKKIKDLHNQTIFMREKQYSSSIKDAPVEGSVELF
ncbi:MULTISPECIES: chemoreceptor glutamine deamidase CheD [Methylomonas]|uniref:Probable chemoreceptor glutamine deamidase CheD n=2 Tax=Methylomonas TaxID=416 RepID=A0A126T878_9GAMM|nr:MULTISPECIES: chemoreceptor glutamine deamidase CheD [Methylomonas]AMK78293.1 chemotaxis protein CheD [Methylomonas denitrificans]OAI04010.1 chemotaxis protein CheD [Methylomonas methanica]TCV87676.1 chemotaxis protein CheD [Methylomonas methanica]